ncbi:TasA family protein [Modestobacter sp. VKM Ac-2979]|uniref:TasA family protein n=1 Tax=unclassified Modestobacter TaxID=2643866 RepID=UPI0022AB8AF5|nr:MULTISPECIES: TasA family protein [unclassified Modestobacter]MCZ2810061.1 TasA family protein [Modestobacter sp. VKM Ac-2979]MCZ2844692.1 TasA family protein [Modestobacter sp. VKM Ac-2980]
MTATTRTRTARKVIGSLGIVGAAAAVAGMGTFGTFTDSTAPLNASVASGTLSLDLNSVNSTATLPMNAAGFVPGDSISRSVDLVNTGDLGFAGIQLTSSATVSSVLDTDKANGLQLSVASCSVTWTESVVNGVATYTCSGVTTPVATGPAVTNVGFVNAASLAPKGSDHLVVTLSLPTTADNTFQGKTSTLALSFTGTQQTGTNR